MSHYLTDLIIKRNLNKIKNLEDDTIEKILIDDLSKIYLDRYKIEPGYLYCLYNDVYKVYGDNLFKLGECCDIKARFSSYCTYYPDPSIIKCQTGKLRNKAFAELVLFEKLKQYRFRSNREFFQCDLSIIRKTFSEIENLFRFNSDEEIIKNIFINPILQKIKYHIQNKNDDKIIQQENEIQIKNIYHQILTCDKDIDKFEYDILAKMNNKSLIDKIRMEKYLLLYHFGINKLNKTFLKTFYEKEYKLYNLIYLIDENNIKNFKYHKIDIDIKRKQCQIINELINLLGFDNIFDNKLIERKKFQENIEKVQTNSIFFKNIKDSYKLFKIIRKNKHIIGVKSFLGFINIILIEYGLRIKALRKSKRINGKIRKISKYKLNFINNIQEFIRFRINKGSKLIDSNNIYRSITNEWIHLL